MLFIADNRYIPDVSRVDRPRCPHFRSAAGNSSDFMFILGNASELFGALGKRPNKLIVMEISWDRPCYRFVCHIFYYLIK